MMTGPELKQLRGHLGDAIGRRLSLADMAKIAGLAPANLAQAGGWGRPERSGRGSLIYLPARLQFRAPITGNVARCR